MIEFNIKYFLYPKLEINEDINSKINKLSIIFNLALDAKVFCQSFETLIELSIKLEEI